MVSLPQAGYLEIFFNEFGASRNGSDSPFFLMVQPEPKLGIFENSFDKNFSHFFNNMCIKIPCYYNI
jgi:hypothetical protein